MSLPQAKTIEVKFPKPLDIDEATHVQTFYYNHLEHPVAPATLAESLNRYFSDTEGWQVECFRPGKPREKGEVAVACFWPKWRKERKPIKTKLQAGVTIPY